MCSVRRSGWVTPNEYQHTVSESNVAIWSSYEGGCADDETDLLQCYSPTAEPYHCVYYVAVSCNPPTEQYSGQQFHFRNFFIFNCTSAYKNAGLEAKAYRH